MGIIIGVAIVLIIALVIRALDSSVPVYPRRRARAMNPRPAPVASTSTHPDTSASFSALAMASHGGWAGDQPPLDDQTRNTDSSTSWDAGANDCAPADSGSWDSGSDSGGYSDSGGCDSGSSD